MSLEEKDKGYKLEIKNLPWNMSWQNLKDAFSTFGQIINADVENDNAVNNFDIIFTGSDFNFLGKIKRSGLCDV